MLGLLTVLIYAAALLPLIIHVLKNLKNWRKSGELDLVAMKLPALLSVGLVIAVKVVFGVRDLWVEYLLYENLGQTEVFLRPMLFRVALGAVKFTFAALVFWTMTHWPLRYLPAVNPPEENAWRHKRILTYNRLWRWLKLARVVLILVVALWMTMAFPLKWQQVMLWLNASSAGYADPIFGNDGGFYLFSYPLLRSIIWHVLWIWLVGLILALVTMYFMVFSLTDRTLAPVLNVDPSNEEAVVNEALYERLLGQLLVLISPLLLFFAGWLWLGRYAELFDKSGRVFGVSWVGDHFTIPAKSVMAAMFLLTAGWLIWNGLRGKMPSRRMGIKISATLGTALLLGTFILPLALQRWVVVPNEKMRELPYLAHQMEATRFGFNLGHLSTESFVPNDSLGFEDVQASAQTLKNARLWDYRALAATLDRIQELKPFFDFPDVDVDRDTINGEYCSYMLASRELNITKLPKEARNWQNDHLVYTHGHGVVMNRVSEFDEGGYPHLLIKDIPAVSTVREIEIKRPEIYFGELTDQYVILNSRVAEFSHVSADSSVYTRYDGKAGVLLGSGLRRLAIAMYFGDSQILLSRDLTAESRVLWHRTIHERVQMLAPFLTMDEDEYKVIRKDGSLAYLIDGYTLSGYMPYAERFYSERFGEISYIRNPVKATVDAYDGSVRMYVFDEQDPILRAWRGIFPSLFLPADQMPGDLHKHVRYPEDLLNTQAAVLADYHMTRPEDFFGREDRWDVATEVYGSSTETQTMEAYNVIIQLPNESAAEFALMLPFVAHNKQNMVGWLAGRSDGEHYGELILYRFPQNKNVAGTMMIETAINQHPEWSQDLTLWRQKGSDVNQSNLLVLPLRHSLFYVEPIYLQAENEPMPQLTRVVVALNERRLAWGKNLDEALKSLFSGQSILTNTSSDPETGVISDPGLIRQALQLLSSYRTLQSAGQYAKAGEALEKLEKLLNTNTKK